MRASRWSVAVSCIPMIENATPSGAASHTWFPNTVRQNKPARQETPMPPNTFRGCATGREGMPAYGSLETLIGAHDQLSNKGASICLADGDPHRILGMMDLYNAQVNDQETFYAPTSLVMKTSLPSLSAKLRMIELLLIMLNFRYEATLLSLGKACALNLYSRCTSSLLLMWVQALHQIAALQRPESSQGAEAG